MTNDCNESLVLSYPHSEEYTTKDKYNKIRDPALPIPFLDSVSSLPQFYNMIAMPDTANYTCLKSTV